MPSPTLGGLTLAPGDYSRVCKQTVPSARAFSPHLFERLFCQAGVIRREKRHVDGFGAFNFATLVFLLLAQHSIARKRSLLALRASVDIKST